MHGRRVERFPCWVICWLACQGIWEEIWCTSMGWASGNRNREATAHKVIFFVLYYPTWTPTPRRNLQATRLTVIGRSSHRQQWRVSDLVFSASNQGHPTPACERCEGGLDAEQSQFARMNVSMGNDRYEIVRRRTFYE